MEKSFTILADYKEKNKMQGRRKGVGANDEW